MLRSLLLILTAADAHAAVDPARISLLLERAQYSVQQVRSAPADSLERRYSAARLLAEDSPLAGTALPVPAPPPAARPAVLAAPDAVPVAVPVAVPAPVQDPAALARLFLALHAAVRSGAAGPLPESAGSFRYLFVRGFMGNHITDYQAASLRRLRELGLSADFINIATEGDRAGDLDRIAEAVRASDKPVILIGHSRGGILIHDWYRTASPDMKAKAARLVLMQAPLQGSPVADYVLERFFLRLAARMLGWLPGWGDVLGTVRELSTQQRSRQLAGMPELSAEDRDKIYTIATAFDPDAGSRNHKDMRYFQRIISRRTGEPNDGMTGISSAGVPGAHNLVLYDLDHEDTVLEHPGWIKSLLGSRPNPDMRADDISETVMRLVLAPPAR